jgi:hypothetical protein
MRYSLLAAIEPRKAFTIGESLQPYERDIKTLAIMKIDKFDGGVSPCSAVVVYWNIRDYPGGHSHTY